VRLKGVEVIEEGKWKEKEKEKEEKDPV